MAPGHGDLGCAASGLREEKCRVNLRAELSGLLQDSAGLEWDRRGVTPGSLCPPSSRCHSLPRHPPPELSTHVSPSRQGRQLNPDDSSRLLPPTQEC